MQLLRRFIRDVLLPQQMVSREPMVFVCGMSRSGTTLLAAVLDAHSRIAMGYELIPPPTLSVLTLREHLRHSMAEVEGDFSRAGSKLRHDGHQDVGQWLARCHRAGARADEVDAVLADLSQRGHEKLQTLH